MGTAGAPHGGHGVIAIRNKGTGAFNSYLVYM